MKLYKKNLKKLIKGNVYDSKDEHDACGVGFVASTDGKKSRLVVEFGIQALKAVWHRGAEFILRYQKAFLLKELKMLVVIMIKAIFVLG